MIFAQDTCKLNIGTNLGGPSDWGVSWPYADIMKFSRTWITANSVWIDGGENRWDTQLLNKIPKDTNGYPLKLPFHIEEAETTQIVRTVWANTYQMPPGRYTVLYEGEGKIEVGFDAINIDYQDGRIEFDLKDEDRDGIIYLAIMESKESNHIRNIRVMLPHTENLITHSGMEYHKNVPFNPVWMQKVKNFGALRFMDWAHTNNSKVETWEDRSKQANYTWTGSGGIPYEEYIRICNRIKADAWVCVPHLATDNHIRKMAELFKDNLDPDLTVYVEYSNEIWNWMFDQTHYLYNNGNQDEPWPERIVPFIQNVLDIWSEVFGDEIYRIKRVVGVQLSYLDVSRRIAENLRDGSVDILSPTAYFHFTEEGYLELDSLGENATPERVIELAKNGIDDEAYPMMIDQKNLADELGLEMAFYEGGQHLTPNPWGTDQPYNQALIDANYHINMYELYNYWFDLVRNIDSSKKLFMHFTLAGPVSGKYGSFGALKNIYDDPPYLNSSPKYQSILDNLCEKNNLFYIQLFEGWNLVSTNTKNSSNKLDSILKSNNILIIKDDTGNIFLPDYNFNSIVNWNYSKAYKIYAIENHKIYFNGDTINYNNFPITLHKGWNYFPYLLQKPENIDIILNELSSGYSLIVTDDELNAYIPALNINKINLMLPGKGYFLYIDKEYIFRY